MSEALDRLRRQREALLRRGKGERAQLADLLEPLATRLYRLDRGVMQLASPKVLLVAGILGALVLGRRRSRALLAAGLSAFGLYRRARTAGGLIATLLGRQPVSRSR